LTVELEIPERDFSLVKAGQKVSIRISSNTELEYKTTLLNLVPAIDPVTRTSKVRVKPFVFKSIPSIEAFAFAEISITNPEIALVIPSDALVFYQNQQWVIKENGGKLKIVPVDVLQENAGKSSVRSKGLAGGDKVLTKDVVFIFKQYRQDLMQ
jgi:Cu(I)/Ag(I) efflux system membrane fusion protein